MSKSLMGGPPKYQLSQRVRVVGAPDWDAPHLLILRDQIGRQAVVIRVMTGLYDRPVYEIRLNPGHTYLADTMNLMEDELAAVTTLPLTQYPDVE